MAAGVIHHNVVSSLNMKLFKRQIYVFSRIAAQTAFRELETLE